MRPLEKSVFDSGYKKIEQYIQSASLHLKTNGNIYIGFSSTLGKLSLLKTIAGKYGYKLKLISQTKSKEIYPANFEVLELKQNSFKKF